MKIKAKFVSISLFVVFAFILLRNGSQYFSVNLETPVIKQYLGHATVFFELTSLGAMAIGGLGAYCLFFNKTFILRILINKWAFVSAIIGVALLFYFSVTIPYFNTEVYSVLFIILITNIGTGQNNLILDSKLLRFLGTISYGIYMYNPVVIKMCMYIYKEVLQFKFGSGFDHLLFSIINFCVTILFAWVSYQLIEKRFLSFKSQLQLQPVP